MWALWAFGWSEEIGPLKGIGLIWFFFGLALIWSLVLLTIDAQLSCHYVPLLCFAQVLILSKYSELKLCAYYRSAQYLLTPMFTSFTCRYSMSYRPCTRHYVPRACTCIVSSSMYSYYVLVTTFLVHVLVLCLLVLCTRIVSTRTMYSYCLYSYYVLVYVHRYRSLSRPCTALVQVLVVCMLKTTWRVPICVHDGPKGPHVCPLFYELCSKNSVL
jgi:hypothetical protein